MGLADFASKVGGALLDPKDTFKRMVAGEGSGLEATFLALSFPALLGALTASIIVGHTGSRGFLIPLATLAGGIVAAIVWVVLAGIAVKFLRKCS